MNDSRLSLDDDVRRYDYDDEVVLAVDLGPGVDGTVDVVEDAVIVVVEDDQFEFPIPDGSARASITNGVVTVEVDR